MELQADCYAGIWGHSTCPADGHACPTVLRRPFSSAVISSRGLNAAAAIGDDRLTRGRVSPESFTHGTSAQRVEWFKRGLESGRLEACDTFREIRLGGLGLEAWGRRGDGRQVAEPPAFFIAGETRRRTSRERLRG